MATQRRGTARRAGRRKPAPRRRQATKQRRAPRQGARASARSARREEVARTIEAAGAPDLHVAAPVEELPREPAPKGAEVPGYARLIAEREGREAAEARRRATEEELARRRREQAPGGEAAGEPPEAGAIALELTLGALRLTRTVVTAPLRIALAFLRTRDE